MSKKVVLAAILLLAANVGPAGKVRGGWETDKPAGLNYFFIPDTAFKDVEGKIGMHSAQATAVAPIALSDSTFLTFGADCQGLFVGYKDIGTWVCDGETYTKNDLPEDLYAIDLVAGLGVDRGDWAVYAEFRPGIHSDLEDVDTRDIYYEGGLMASYAFSEAFSASLGLYYDDSFGEPELYPLAGAQWLIGGGFVLDAFLPSYLIVSCQPGSRIRFGLRGRLDGHQFRLRKLIWDDTVVKYEQVMIGPFVDFSLTGTVVLRIEGGVAVARKFEFRDDDSSEKLYDGDVRDGGYLSAAINLEY